MSKIFRLYKEGKSTYEDWNADPSFPYNSNNRDTIEDPDGASAKNEITSIPSPFARIDLIKTAFKEVCKCNRRMHKIDLDGNSIYHKMVSDTLDVAEIFFNIDRYKSKIEVIKWDAAQMINELETSGIPGHRYMADTLRKYLKSDAHTYNFSTKTTMYLLNYKTGPKELNIIGATSPATLFFSNANDLTYIKDIYFGDDKPFDAEYQPLYKRDFEFVKYLFAQRYSIPQFAELFPEVDAYLEKTFEAISELEKKQELKAISTNTLSEYVPITLSEGASDYVEVLGHPLYQKSASAIKIVSDFTIKTARELQILPLVLPVEPGNRYSQLRYTTAKWGTTNAAPYVDKQVKLSERRLPFDGNLMPYLTIGDFLEDEVIKVPYQLNTDKYFDAHFKNTTDKFSYLLPLKTLFFEYFSTENLMGTLPDGKPMIEMEGLANNMGLKVTLRIPISGNKAINYVEYQRLYYVERSAEPESNEGAIVQINFSGFIMPQVRFNTPAEAIYNLACMQDSEAKNNFTVYACTPNPVKVQPTEVYRRDSRKEETIADSYLFKGSHIDFIQVSNHHGYSGIMLPKFQSLANANRKFEFAIDLGTSNTHIEYRQDGEKPRIFTIEKGESHPCLMFVPKVNELGNYTELTKEIDIIEKDNIPLEIGVSDFYFPTRTVLSVAKKMNWSNRNEPFVQTNMLMTYDKRLNRQAYNDVFYNIKWEKENGQDILGAYIRNLMLMLRNKVLLNNGDLQQTKITWFYPISMSPRRRNTMKSIWDAAYNEYFGSGSTQCMTESEAPIQYYFKKFSTATDLVNVDIGGGTTDIAFARNNQIHTVTSFHFAANILFEDAYSELDSTNGIIDFYKPIIKKLLKDNQLHELLRMFDSTNNQEHPANMASFLFGLKDNSILRKANLNTKAVDFNHILSEDEHFKIVFLLFYTAIIYHIAQTVKFLNLEVPRHIAFSGNGSKVIRVLTPNARDLAYFTKVIFEKVLGKPYDKELELIGLNDDFNPKEVTCKGGLTGVAAAVGSFRDMVLKSDGSGLIETDDTYQNLGDAYRKRSVKAVSSFFNFVFNDLCKQFKVNDYFGIDNESLNIAKSVCYKDLNTFMDKGIAQRLEETNADNMVEETFFFYPIKGALQALSREIFNYNLPKMDNE